jgi:tol-pal system protein YbgF
VGPEPPGRGRNRCGRRRPEAALSPIPGAGRACAGLAGLAGLVGLGLTTGCALKGDVRRVELQVEALRVERARADSQGAAKIDSVRALLSVVQEKLVAQQAYLVQLRGDMKTELLAVQQQLVAVQELTGQSQQRLTELRGRLEEQARQPVPTLDTTRAGSGAGAPGGTGVPVGPSGNPAGPGPDQMYDLSLQQFRRGSLATARLGFREFLRVFPTNERAADALFYVGETFGAENADSAAAAYQQVVKSHPNSARAPAALYKLGLLAERRGDKAAARTYYARVIAGYPRSDEANLARDKLQRLGR